MPNLGTPELVIVLVVVFLIFGAGKLPRLGRELGQSVQDFRAALSDDGETPNTES